MAISKTAAGTWAVDFRSQECHCDKIQGQHRHRIQKTFDTYKEAVAYEKEKLDEVEKREFVKPSDKTVREIAEEWYQKKVDAGTYRRASLIDYYNHVENYIKRQLGNWKVHDIDVEKIEKAAAEWGKKVSPKMVNKALTTLTAILALAKRYKLIKDNPGEEAERLKIATENEDDIEVTPDRVYSKQEIRKLIEASEPGSRDRLLVMVPALTGLRIGEVLGLTWPAVDLKFGKLDVRFNLADSDKGQPLLLQPPKTKKSRRTIPLPPELIHELKVWKLKCPKSDQDLVLAREDGEPYHRNTASKALDRAIATAEITKRLTPHGLRHTFASLLLADSVPVPEVSALLGHKDSYVTWKVYAHFVKKESSAVQNLAASILSGN
jgi:integrase